MVICVGGAGAGGCGDGGGGDGGGAAACFFFLRGYERYAYI